jgi:hypothetical protein
LSTYSGAPDNFESSFDRLHDVVASLVGTADFGGRDYVSGLKVLLQSMDYDPRFTEWGRGYAWQCVVEALASRAIAVKSMAKTPGYDSREISAPVIITGIPRTGTTALHKLLAVDPQFQGLEKWLLSAPGPRPPREQWESNPLFEEEVARLEAKFARTPNLRAAHHMAADEIEECLWIQRQSFVSNYWNYSWSAASYDAWWQSQSEVESYRYLYSNLQLIGNNDRDRRWLLKNPSHVLNLNVLLSVFPGAKVIQTHRDPAKAVPSLCALLLQGFPLVEEGRLDLRAKLVGRREVEKWAKGARDTERIKRSHPGLVLDVRHAEFHAEPLKVVKAIYRFLDMELSPAVRAAMIERSVAAPELSHGVHSYRASEFGLSEAEIRERFGDYVYQYELAPPRGAGAGADG